MATGLDDLEGLDGAQPALPRRDRRSPRVGILAERGAAIFTWDATRAALDAAGAQLIYLQEHPTNATRRSPGQVVDRLIWRAVALAENRLVDAPQRHYRPSRPVVLPCEFHGHFKTLADTAIEMVRALDLDVVLRLGGRGIYRGAILDVAPGGLLSIHHGDNRRFRGGPPGFWEIMAGAPRMGFVVQRLTETLDGGAVLARGEAPVGRLAAANRKTLYDLADTAMASVVTSYIEQGRWPEPEPRPASLGPIYRMPSLADIVRYCRLAWLGRGRPRVSPRGPDPRSV